MNSRPVLSACVLLTLGFASPAWSQATEAQMNAIKSNCRSDYMAKCMSVKPGGPEAFQCLKKNEASLSAACKSAVNAISASSGGAAPAQPAPAAAAPAPATPHAAASPASPPPAAAAPVAKPAVAATPPAHQKPAAAPTTSAQPSAAQQNAIKQSCRNDFMAHCSGVQPGGAAALSCLQTNAGKLTPACKSAVAAIGGSVAPAAAKPAVAAVTPPAAAAPVATPEPVLAPKLDSPMEARMIREFCFTDFKVLCKGVRLGQGRALKCLADNGPALSPGCKAAMVQASR